MKNQTLYIKQYVQMQLQLNDDRNKDKKLIVKIMQRYYANCF